MKRKKEKAERGEERVYVPTLIAGRAHYAEVACGEWVWCVREPGNLYDCRAIAVHAPDEAGEVGKLLGYVPAYLAQWLAPILDTKPLGFSRWMGLLFPGEEQQGRPHFMLHLPVEASCLAAAFEGKIDTREGVWVRALLGLWNVRGEIGADALERFVMDSKAVFKEAGFSPWTKLLFRGLRGEYEFRRIQQVREERKAKREAEERRMQEEAARKAAKAAAEQETVRCRLAGEWMAFGHLRLLPIAPVHSTGQRLIPLKKGLVEGYAVVTGYDHHGKNQRLRVKVGGDDFVAALPGSVLHTTAGAVRVRGFCLMNPREHTRYLVHVSPVRERPSAILEGVEGMRLPEWPVLPKEATGFAVFHGKVLRAVRLFAFHETALEALETVRWMDWEIRPGKGVLTEADALEVVNQGWTLKGDGHILVRNPDEEEHVPDGAVPKGAQLVVYYLDIPLDQQQDSGDTGVYEKEQGREQREQRAVGG